MVDLLVSIAVMALLIAILLPSLGRAQEAARRSKSASNIRQQGIALTMFAFDRMGEMPTSVFNAKPRRGQTGEDAPEQMVMLRVGSDTLEASTGRTINKSNGETEAWDGLGKLFEREYVAQGQIFYNPSHRAGHDYARYEAQFHGAEGEVVGNYHYRSENNVSSIDRVKPRTTLIADAMRTRVEYNHVVGNNMLKGDMSVTWYQDVTRELYQSLAKDLVDVVASTDTPSPADQDASRIGVIRGWKILDKTTDEGTAVSADSANDPVGAFFGFFDPPK